jgi:hypothetical protein
MKQQIALATKHGKLNQLKPAFKRLADFELVPAEIDTDLFGTFSGETPRTSSPLETAIAKAKAGAQALGLDYGLASEGTISPNPAIPWATVDHELLVLVCLSRDITIYETYQSGSIVAKTETLAPSSDLNAVFIQFDLPTHAVNLSFSQEAAEVIEKGISDTNYLRNRIAALWEQGYEPRLESDFRAMSSPSRQANIMACAEKLADRIANICPGCSEIGFGKISYEFGVPCLACGEVNSRVPKSEKHGCVACDFFELRDLGITSIDPSRCDGCNP